MSNHPESEQQRNFAEGQSGRFLENARVVRHEVFRGDYHLIWLRAPWITASVRPGQFLHLRVPHLDAQLMRRPFSIFKVEGDTLALLYKVVGSGTSRMSLLREGEEMPLLGPLGHPYLPSGPGVHPVLVAGGYGTAAMYLLARACAEPGTLFIGGRTADDILCAEDFRALGWHVEIATEDGSQGHTGLVTVPLEEWLKEAAPGLAVKLYSCGPNGLLRAVALIAERYQLPCEVSVDMPMCCGVGACLTCVIKVASTAGDEEGFEWARTCTEGPVFDARDVLWDSL